MKNEIRRLNLINDGRSAPVIYQVQAPSYEFAFAVCSRMHPANAIRTLAVSRPRSAYGSPYFPKSADPR